MLIYLCICLFGDDELSMTMKVAALGGHSGAENICNLPSSHSGEKSGLALVCILPVDWMSPW